MDQIALGKRIKAARERAGMTQEELAAAVDYSVDHMFLLTLLAENGMTEKDVNIVDMSIQESGTAFVAGQCDAACIWDPYFSQAIASGGTKLYSSSDKVSTIVSIVSSRFTAMILYSI